MYLHNELSFDLGGKNNNKQQPFFLVVIADLRLSEELWVFQRVFEMSIISGKLSVSLH